MTEVQGQRMAAHEQKMSLQRSYAERKLSPSDRLQIAGKLAELNEKLISLNAQLALYKEKEKELSVRSPMKGEVLTWDLRNRLINRPVQRGQILMRVANPAGPWQLELEMPENHIGPVVEYQKKLYEEAREVLRGLLVEQARQKSPDAAQEDIDQAVDADLDKVPDRDLDARISDIYLRRLCAALQPIVADATDEATRTRLGEVLHAKTYAEALAKLDALTQPAGDDQPAIDPALLARLKDLPREEVPDTRMEVSYVLATESGTTYKGRIVEIHRSAEISGDEGNTVTIKVAINKGDLPDLRTGTTVTAKVYCGRRSLGYVYLRDVISFIQSRILFRYF